MLPGSGGTNAGTIPARSLWIQYADDALSKPNKRGGSIENRRPILRVLALPFIALFLAACAGGSDLPELEPEQALLRVQNEMADARVVSIAIEDLAGNTVPLGNVERGTAQNFVLLAPDYTDDIRLVAVAPGDEDRGDHVVSETITVQAGWTINWFLPSNTVEVHD